MAKLGQGGANGGTMTGFMPGANGGLGDLFSRGGGGILPERGSKSQRDAVMSLLASSMSSANQANSPLLSFLTPMIGSAVASRTQGLYDESQSKKSSEMGADLLAAMGGGANGARALEILSDPDAPQHLKTLATTMLARDTKAPSRGRSGSARKRAKDRNGVLRFIDDGSAVFPDVTGGGRVNADVLRQQNIATTAISSAINDLVQSGIDPAEARESVRNDPLYSRQWGMIDAIEQTMTPDEVTTKIGDGGVTEAVEDSNDPLGILN